MEKDCAGSSGSGYCNLYISKDSKWVVTGDSTLTKLASAGTIADKSGSDGRQLQHDSGFKRCQRIPDQIFYFQEIYEEDDQDGEGEKDEQNRDEIKEEKDILRQGSRL